MPNDEGWVTVRALTWFNSSGDLHAITVAAAARFVMSDVLATSDPAGP
jgi:hypothetical protein